MKSKHQRLLCFSMILLMAWTRTSVYAWDAGKIDEPRIKMAFIYNFIRFVDWPPLLAAEKDDPIRIVVVNPVGYDKAFEEIKDKQISDRNVTIESLSLREKLKNARRDIVYEQAIEQLKACDVVFFHEVDNQFLIRVFHELRSDPILLIGQKPGFLEQGGIINFVKADGKIRFEINLAASKARDLPIRSKLLKLARRVITESQ